MIYCASLLNSVQIIVVSVWLFTECGGAVHVCVWVLCAADLWRCQSCRSVAVHETACRSISACRESAASPSALNDRGASGLTITHTHAKYQTCSRQAEGKQPALQLFRQLNNSIMSHYLDRFNFWWKGIISTIRLVEMSLEWATQRQTDVCSGDKQIHLVAHDLFIYCRMCLVTHHTAGFH